MPEFTAVTVALLALVLVMGIVLGWILRGDRCAREKIAVNAGWQQQIEAQQSEHDRLAKQNKSLMEQISQYQASIKDSTLRARELSDSLKETFQRRDELQRQIKDIRNNLEGAIAQRDRLQGDLRNRSAKDEAMEQSIQQRDEKIRRLTAELANWQSRVPPLVDRYRLRDEEARELEEELAGIRTDLESVRAEREDARSDLESAQSRIAALEAGVGSEHTRIEPVDANTLPADLNASNEPHDDTIENEVTGLKDQIDSDELPLSQWQPDDEDRDGLPPEIPADDNIWARVSTTPAADEDSETALAAEPDLPLVDFLDAGDIGIDAELPPYVAAYGNATGGDLLAGTNSTGSADDLRQIKGVGPSIEKTLNDLGFFRFSQIAGMTELDIDRVARRLKGFRGRIYREDWIGQARLLHQQKYENRH
jgi:peptidoglycan hydrolase CwlO-like protein